MKKFIDAFLFVKTDIYAYKTIWDMFGREKKYICEKSGLEYRKTYYCSDLNEAIERHKLRLERKGVELLAQYVASDLDREYNNEVGLILQMLSSECRNVSYEVVAREADDFIEKPLSYAIKELSFDDFAEYLKDKGIAVDVISDGI